MAGVDRTYTSTPSALCALPLARDLLARRFDLIRAAEKTDGRRAAVVGPSRVHPQGNDTHGSRVCMQPQAARFALSLCSPLDRHRGAGLEEAAAAARRFFSRILHVGSAQCSSSNNRRTSSRQLAQFQ
jgi:hypothetical protein